MRTAEVMVALASRYSAPAWALLPEVRNGTGYLRTTRTADALAMSLWPSRGLELHGFEVKCDRVDWLRELKDPAKAEEISQFCDRWWVVAGDKDLVRDGELPPTWGLLVPRGNQLVVKVEAPKFEAVQPVDRLFLASLLRKVTETWTPRVDVAAVREAATADGKKSAELDVAHWREQHAGLLERVRKFEVSSGVTIDDWRGDNVGKIVRDVVEKGPVWFRRVTEIHKEWAQRIVDQCEEALRDDPDTHH